jgi:hypothetical protein
MRLPRWWSYWQTPLLWGGLALFLFVGLARIVYEIHHPLWPR